MLEINKIQQGDCLELMKQIDVSVDLIITDPPYNRGWKYSDKVNDNKKDYHQWCIGWFELCFNTLKENGLICIINYPENNNILFTNLL